MALYNSKVEFAKRRRWLVFDAAMGLLLVAFVAGGWWLFSAVQQARMAAMRTSSL
jgi:hypothetical protein